MLGLMCGKLFCADRPITIRIDVGERRCIADVTHRITLLGSLADSFATCFIELVFNNFSVAIEVIVGECRHIATHAGAGTTARSHSHTSATALLHLSPLTRRKLFPA